MKTQIFIADAKAVYSQYLKLSTIEPAFNSIYYVILFN
jgi:hypothetical protein